MNRKDTAKTALQAKGRVVKGLDALLVGLGPYVERRMSKRYGRHWRHYASRAAGGDRSGELDLYALLKTLLAHWREVFSDDAKAEEGTQLHLALHGCAQQHRALHRSDVAARGHPLPRCHA